MSILSSDYVVSREFGDGFICTKYASGYMEVDGYKAVTANITEPWGNIYFGNVPNIAYGATFTTVYSATATVISVGSAFIITLGVGKSAFSTVQIARGTVSSNHSTQIGYRVVGKWK